MKYMKFLHVLAGKANKVQPRGKCHSGQGANMTVVATNNCKNYHEDPCGISA